MNAAPERALVTRFAPSPTGYMHLGHAYSALKSYLEAQAAGGRFILRLEDIDRSRARDEFEAAIREDLAWLGIEWEGAVRCQSEHYDDYAGALDELARLDLLYPCFCTRKAIRDEIAHADAAPHGPDGPVYPGRCRELTRDEQNRRMRGDEAFALRLNVARAIEAAGPLFWTDRKRGRIEATPEAAGDVVLARKDVPTSYHLAVTLDDHLQGVNLVARGEDLFEATHIHRLLQALLGLNTPDYHHHGLITDDEGRRLAKRNRAVTLRTLRKAGKTPEQILAMIGL